ncbi:MAG: hypothetical protein AABY22_25605, partial [Nanoarchaeota archaeon]
HTTTLTKNCQALFSGKKQEQFFNCSRLRHTNARLASRIVHFHTSTKLLDCQVLSHIGEGFDTETVQIAVGHIEFITVAHLDVEQLHELIERGDVVASLDSYHVRWIRCAAPFVVSVVNASIFALIFN